MKKRIVGMVISVLLIIGGIVLPVKSGIALLMLVVGFLGIIFFWVMINAARGVIPEIEGGKKTDRTRYKIHLEKKDDTNVWDVITEQNNEKE